MLLGSAMQTGSSSHSSNQSSTICCMSSDLSPPADFAAHLARLRQLPQHIDPSLRTLFDRRIPIHIARAPGRLDIMGGIGDYSGSLVLELPIAEAAFAAVQATRAPNVTVVSLRLGAET